MWRLRTGVVAVSLAVAACGGEQPAEDVTSTEPATFPTAVVQDWLDAVDGGDLADIAAAVEETSAAILIATENGYTIEELAALLDGGVPEGVAASYWGSFKDSFAEFRGQPLSSLVVGDFRPLDVESAEFAAVELTSAVASSEVITRKDETGRWQIDMVATFGPALVRNLRGMLDDAADDPNGTVVRTAYARAVLPGLAAAVELHLEDTLLRSQLGAMEVLVGDQ